MLIVVIIGSLCIYTFIYLFKTYSYWEKRHVKYIKPVPFFGNMFKFVFKQCPITDLYEEVYNGYPDERYVGVYNFTKPVLVIRDPKLIQKIMVTNFEQFRDYEGAFCPEIDPLFRKTLFGTEGQKWQEFRQTLSPIFTSKNINFMFDLIQECALNCTNYYKNKPNEIIHVEVKDIFERYTFDAIATTSFGTKTNSFTAECENNKKFLKLGRQLADMKGFSRFKLMVYSNFPLFVKLFDLKIIEDEPAEVFIKTIDGIIKSREKNNMFYPDFLQFFMESRKRMFKYEVDKAYPKLSFAATYESGIGKSRDSVRVLTNQEIMAQTLSFLFAGYETISSTMTFLVYELATNPEIQTKLRSEFQSFSDEISYKTLINCRYLDQVICETLRKWPQTFFCHRKCTEKFVIGAERQGEVPITLNIGDSCWIPLWGLHHDSNYYPNPHQFDPERFNDDNRNDIQRFTYLPFGAGPRNCIGSQFAILQMKILTYHLVKEFEIVPVKDTEIPIVLCKDNYLVAPEKGFVLGLIAVKQ